MRRPITFVFASFAGGIFLGYYLGVLACLCLLGSIFFISLLVQGQSHLIALILIGLIGACYIGTADSFPDPLLDYDGEVICLEGNVISVEDRETYYKILLKARSWTVDGISKDSRQKLIANISYSSLGNCQLLGQDIRVTGRLSQPTGARNPGLFDYKLYLKSRGIVATISSDTSHIEIVGERLALFSAPGKLKAHFSTLLDQYIGKDSKALLMGILFGDKAIIDDDIYESFQRNGCAHILSVSGIHVGIIYIYINKIFRNRRSRAGITCILILLIFYASLAEFSPSVLRAVTMIAVHIFSKPLHRRYDLLCCISFSALIMLIFNPFKLFNIGFQLSYLAVFTLAFAMPLVESKISRPVLLLRPFIPIIVIQVGMAPAIAYHFMYFSFSAYIVNVPVIALSSLILPLGICMVLLSIIPGTGFIMGPGLMCLEIAIKAMTKLNLYFASSDISSMNIKAPPLFFLVLFYGMFFFLSSEAFWMQLKRKDKKKILLVCLSIVVFSLAVPLVMKENLRGADIVFLDVGQGDCVHIKTENGKNVLIDGGGSRNYDTGKKVLLPYLLKNRVGKIDLALVTHLHQDHYGGIASLCKLMPVEKLGVYEGYILKEEKLKKDTGLSREDILYMVAGDKITIDDKTTIHVLYPKKMDKEKYKEVMADEEDENHSCLVMKVFYDGISILITGDVGFEGEGHLLNMGNNHEGDSLESQILKVGHHGSRYSTGDEFLDYVDPRIAVIQSGKNNFGHPHPDIIEKLRKKGIMIFRNDRHGAVLLKIRGRQLKIHTMLGEV